MSFTRLTSLRSLHVPNPRSRPRRLRRLTSAATRKVISPVGPMTPPQKRGKLSSQPSRRAALRSPPQARRKLPSKYQRHRHSQRRLVNNKVSHFLEKNEIFRAATPAVSVAVTAAHDSITSGHSGSGCRSPARLLRASLDSVAASDVHP